MNTVHLLIICHYAYLAFILYLAATHSLWWLLALLLVPSAKVTSSKQRESSTDA